MNISTFAQNPWLPAFVSALFGWIVFSALMLPQFLNLLALSFKLFDTNNGNIILVSLFAGIVGMSVGRASSGIIHRAQFTKAYTYRTVLIFTVLQILSLTSGILLHPFTGAEHESFAAIYAEVLFVVSSILGAFLVLKIYPSRDVS